jgi:hypothetical protein
MANLYTHIKNVTDTSTVLVAHAWGVLPKTVRRNVERMVDSTDLSVARKVRADAGKTIFNSNKRRKSTYTPRFCFLQKKRRVNPGERLTTEELDSAWRNASPQTKAVANHEAQKLLQRGPFLVHEIYDVLSKTNGCITWAQLTTQVSGGDGQVRPFSNKTVREFVMGLPDSSYKSTRIFPLLDKNLLSADTIGRRRSGYFGIRREKSFGTLLWTASTTYRPRRLLGLMLATTRW